MARIRQNTNQDVFCQVRAYILHIVLEIIRVQSFTPGASLIDAKILGAWQQR
jgi:hypothetical protein